MMGNAGYESRRVTSQEALADIRAIVFDLDGTLYVMPAWLKAYMAWRLWRSLPFLRQLNASRDWLRPGRFDGRRELLAAFFGELGRRTGRAAGAAERWYVDSFFPTFIDALRRHGRVRPRLSSLLAQLSQKGVELWVLSDYGYVSERLAALQVAPALFHGLRSCEEFGALKPAPDSFVAVCSQIGCKPHQVLVVGDRYALDGIGAQAAGMKFIGVHDGRDPPSLGFLRWDELERRLLGLVETTR